MPSTALVEMSADLDVFRVGELLAKSGYFTDVKDMAQAVAKILAGREMGFGAIASLMGVYIQNGRPCYSANMIAAAVKKSQRYDYRIKLIDGQSCEIEFYEGGKPVGVSTFSLKDADQAGLTTGKNAHSWKHYPRNMLFARALTNGARFYCPDTFGGVPVYTPEELDVPIDGESGEAFTAQPAVTLPEKPSPAQLPAPARTRYTGEGDGPMFTPTENARPVVINEAQRKRLYTLASKANLQNDTVKDWLKQEYGYSSSNEIRASHYDAICAAITSGKVTVVKPTNPVPGTLPFDYVAIVEQAGLTMGEFEAFVREAYSVSYEDLNLEQREEVARHLKSGYVMQWALDIVPKQEQAGGQA